MSDDATANVLGTGTTSQTSATTDQTSAVLGTNGAGTSSSASLSGSSVQSDPATGSVAGSQPAAAAAAVTNAATNTTSATPIPIIDRLTLDETNETNLEARMTIAETNIKSIGESVNAITDAFNAYVAKVGTGMAATGDLAGAIAKMDRLAVRIFGGDGSF